MKIQFVLHADFEQPGVIATWANQKGFETKYCRPFLGETIPTIHEFDWLVVMGGPQSPLKLETYPFLRNEIELIKQALLANKTVLGFCLGAQLLGEAFDAPTERSPHKEVGVFPIELTEEGCSDPLLQGIPRKLSVVHWHNDMPGLTQESRALAVSDGCPRQIIRYSKRAYGFQCHLETTRQDIEEMIEHSENDFVPGKYIQSKSDFLASDFSSINAVMDHILERLLILELYS
ncbi:MAG: hypothetical protein K940chlam3_01093 [Chlamydiae bacterium]|nr:hypothetical protein [Chlamydiota bacterium]